MQAFYIGMQKYQYICRDRLEKLLVDRAKCEIISHTKNSRLDAYILSESSMFISTRRFILKTCGRTTPLEILPELKKLAKVHGGFDAIENIFYSRKNFARPELQPNSSFETEVALLDSIFPQDGAAYCMGRYHYGDYCISVCAQRTY